MRRIGQNITYQNDKANDVCTYETKLCQFVMGKEKTVWNLSWLKPELTEEFPAGSICNAERLEKLTPVITFRETRE